MLLNSPGQRPNGVYDRFPLGGFTLLHGSLLGPPGPPTEFRQYKGFRWQTLQEKFFGHTKNKQKNVPSIFICV